MIKVNYDAVTGKIKGYYPDEIGYASIPEPYIEIDAYIWKDCINNQGKRKVDLTTLEIIEYTPTIDEEEIKKQKLDALNQEYFIKKEALNKRHSSIVLGNTDQSIVEEKIASLKLEYEALQNELIQKQEAIING